MLRLRHGTVDLYVDEEAVMVTTIVEMAEAESEEQPRRGWIMGCTAVPRNRYSGHWRLMFDYFIDGPVYEDDTFCRRYGLLHGILQCLRNELIRVMCWFYFHVSNL
jgi:hypothetical protein